MNRSFESKDNVLKLIQSADEIGIDPKKFRELIKEVSEDKRI